MAEAGLPERAPVGLAVPAETAGSRAGREIEGAVEARHVCRLGRGLLRRGAPALLVRVWNGHLLPVAAVADGDVQRSAGVERVVVHSVHPLVRVHLQAFMNEI